VVFLPLPAGTSMRRCVDKCPSRDLLDLRAHVYGMTLATASAQPAGTGELAIRRSCHGLRGAGGGWFRSSQEPGPKRSTGV